jgi:hypothetical protein
MRGRRPGPIWLLFYGRQRTGTPWLLFSVAAGLAVLVLTFALPESQALEYTAELMTVAVLGLLIVGSLAMVLLARLRPGRRIRPPRRRERRGS